MLQIKRHCIIILRYEANLQVDDGVKNMDREILLIEDDEDLRLSICRKLERSGYTVHKAADLGQARRLFKERQVPLILCDIDLPDGSGLKLCTEFRQYSDVLFLFLTAMDTEEDMINGYAAGADDYITKPFYPEVLVSKVNAMFVRGDKGEEKKRIVCDGIVLYTEERRAQKDGENLNLTAREYALLEYLMMNPMRILSKNQMLGAIWDREEAFVDENTLAVNIRRLREKIETDPSNPEYIRNMRGLGYIWERNCVRR